MRKILLLLCCVVACALSACNRQPKITQAELARRTQELADSFVPGNKDPWNRYLADDGWYFDETGRNKNKQSLLADLTPLPQGYTGSIQVVNVQSHIEKNVAIMSYDMDEKESVFGQNLNARYHETDTWLLRKGQWQIAAAQVLRYYEDPAPGPVDVKTFADYVGIYELTPGQTLTILRDKGELYRQRENGPKTQLIPETDGIFFRKGVEGRILFRRARGGKVDALIDRRNNEDIVWKKVGP